MADASELKYAQTINGMVILPDGVTISAMRARFQGQSKGFSELERMLDNHEKLLREKLNQQDNKAT
jgi:hypothetical protein